MEAAFGLKLRFDGALASEHSLDFYDAAQALIGFQRSLALTTHLIINGEVITQAPSLKGAKIQILPPSPGSWEIWAVLSIGGAVAYKLGTAPKDTPLGHLVRSAYVYVISELCGFHVDYDKTLGIQYEQMKSRGREDLPLLSSSKFDSLIEKCESAVESMHRPLVASETAEVVQIEGEKGISDSKFDFHLTKSSYDHIKYTIESETLEMWSGSVSSFNINTFQGRIYLPDESRPIPFKLEKNCRDMNVVRVIANSLSENVNNPRGSNSAIIFEAISRRSRSGRLKSLLVLKVY